MCHTSEVFHALPQALQEDVALDPVAAALARLIQRMPDRLLPKMHFEGDFCIGCDWRRINLTESSKVCAQMCKMCLYANQISMRPCHCWVVSGGIIRFKNHGQHAVHHGRACLASKPSKKSQGRRKQAGFLEGVNFGRRLRRQRSGARTTSGGTYS